MICSLKFQKKIVKALASWSQQQKVAKTTSKSLSLSNSPQYSPFFTFLMYALYGHPRYFKFKQKYQQYGPCFQTISKFLMTMVLPFKSIFLTINKIMSFSLKISLGNVGKSLNNHTFIHGY